MSKGKQGGNTGGIEQSADRRRRRAAGRKAQDRRWSARSGQVTVMKVEGGSVHPDSEPETDEPDRPPTGAEGAEDGRTASTYRTLPECSESP